MAYQVLARKWRPKIFDEVVGQQHVAKSLRNSLKLDQLGHAYLFSGTRGVGKTSVARIFAKAIRCSDRTSEGNPCNRCSSCQEIDKGISMDVVELDAASNNGVEDIKNLLETTHMMPMFGGYKIYIIDEIHMLSTSAFNALLKTLEEPPEHVVFIFATTEVEKLIDTVRSRCQRFDFRHVVLEDLVKHLKFIAEQEKITFEKPKLMEQIAQLGQGSVRDMLSIMDQVLSFSTYRYISEEVMVSSLGIASSGSLCQLVTYLLQGEVVKLNRYYYQLLLENIEVEKIIYGVLDHLYNIITHIKDGDYLQKEQLIDLSVLQKLNFAELFWIFETLNKDAQWALKGFDPVKTIDLCLQKVALRREFYSCEGKNINNSQIRDPESPSEDKKKSEVLSPAEYLEDEVLNSDDSCVRSGTPILVTAEKMKKNWENFLSYVEQYSPGGRARLEQGDIKFEPHITAGILEVELCFKPVSAIFYEHLIEQETKQTMLELLSKFYEVDKKSINFKLTLLAADLDSNFKSRAEQREEKRIRQQQIIKDRLKNHDLVNKAKELFSTDIDSVKLTNE